MCEEKSREYMFQLQFEDSEFTSMGEENLTDDTMPVEVLETASDSRISFEMVVIKQEVEYTDEMELEDTCDGKIHLEDVSSKDIKLEHFQVKEELFESSTYHEMDIKVNNDEVNQKDSTLFQSEDNNRKIPEKSRSVDTINQEVYDDLHSTQLTGRMPREFKQRDNRKKYFTRQEKSFKCDVCDKVFERLTLLNHHMISHSEEKNFNCNKCEKRFKYKYHLKEHSLSHSKNRIRPKCNICGKDFGKKSSLKTHMVLHSEEEKFNCPTCCKPIGKSYLDRHMLLHAENKKYKCTVCSKEFRQKFTLTEHTRTHSDEKEYKCTICGIKCRFKSNLTKHSLIHTKDKEFKCNECGKGFISKRYLDRHSLIHTDVKDYNCDICGKSFRHKSTMNRHILLMHVHKKGLHVKVKVECETDDDEPTSITGI